MNLNIFKRGYFEEGWAIDNDYNSIKQLYEEILFEIKEYADQTASDFVCLHDKTIVQILISLRTILSKLDAPEEVLNDLINLSNPTEEVEG